MADHWKSLQSKLGAPGIEDEVETQLPEESPAEENAHATPEPAPQVDADVGAAPESLGSDESVPPPAEPRASKPKAKKKPRRDGFAELLGEDAEVSGDDDGPVGFLPEEPEDDSEEKAASVETDLVEQPRAEVAPPQPAKPPAAKSSPKKKRSSWEHLARMFGRGGAEDDEETEDEEASSPDEISDEIADPISQVLASEDTDDAGNAVLDEMFAEAERDAPTGFKAQPRVIEDVDWDMDDQGLSFKESDKREPLRKSNGADLDGLTESVEPGIEGDVEGRGDSGLGEDDDEARGARRGGRRRRRRRRGGDDDRGSEESRGREPRGDDEDRSRGSRRRDEDEPKDRSLSFRDDDEAQDRDSEEESRPRRPAGRRRPAEPTSRDGDSDDSETVTRRSNRRRRRGRNREEEEIQSDLETVAEVEEPRRRRRGRDEDRGRGEERVREEVADEGVSFRDDDDSEVAEESGEERRGRRRRRPRRRDEGGESGERESRRSRPARRDRKPPEETDEFDGDGEQGERIGRNVPTWTDSLETIIAANTENHKRNEGRSSRGRSRGRRQ